MLGDRVGLCREKIGTRELKVPEIIHTHTHAQKLPCKTMFAKTHNTANIHTYSHKDKNCQYSQTHAHK